MGFHILVLVSETANLIEKIKYFHDENGLIIAEFGETLFRAYVIIEKLETLAEIKEPLDIEEFKENINSLNDRFNVSEDYLFQSLTMELGIMSNIVTENLRYDFDIYTYNDVYRICNSIYSYVLFILILVCKHRLNLDDILQFNIDEARMRNTSLNLRDMDDC